MVALRMSLYFSSKGSVRPCAAAEKSFSSSVRPLRAVRCRHHAAGEEGENGGAVTVLVLLLKGLRQALRSTPYRSGCVSAHCAVLDRDDAQVLCCW